MGVSGRQAPAALIDHLFIESSLQLPDQHTEYTFQLACHRSGLRFSVRLVKHVVGKRTYNDEQVPDIAPLTINVFHCFLADQVFSR